jgi:DedD protein
MEESLKQRLVGAAILIGSGVIFIPMFLGDPLSREPFWQGSPVPARPAVTANSESSPLDAEYFSGLEKTTTTTEQTSPPPAEKKPTTQPPAAPAQVKPISEKPAPAPAEPVTPKEPTAPIAEKPAQPSKPATPAPPTQEHVGVAAWVIQMGSFTSEENAKLLETKLRQQGYPAFVDKIYVQDAKVFRVRVGPELIETRAKEMQVKIEQDINLKGIVVRYP